MQNAVDIALSRRAWLGAAGVSAAAVLTACGSRGNKSSALPEPGSVESSAAEPGIVKPTPADLMEDTGSGLDYGTRPDRMPGELIPDDRFFLRRHAPATDWAVRQTGGDGAVSVDAAAVRIAKLSVLRGKRRTTRITSDCSKSQN